MKNCLTALVRVAEELAELAKSSMPEMRTGEVLNREWLADGIYYQERILDGKTYHAQFDFKKRTSSMIAV